MSLSVHKISAMFVDPSSSLTDLEVVFFPQHFCTSVLQRIWILFRKVFDNIAACKRCQQRSLVCIALEVSSDVTAAAQFCPPNFPWSPILSSTEGQDLPL